MRMYRYLAPVTAAALLGTLPAMMPASAATTNVLTIGGPAGSSVAVNDVLNATVKAGTTVRFSSAAAGSTGVTCAGSGFSATVGANPAAPGIATETLAAQNFSGCTSNVLGVTGVRGVTVNNLPYNTTVNGTTKAVTVTGTAQRLIQTTIVLNTILGTTTCVYVANGNTVTGTSSNTDNSIAFVDQQFNKSVGPFTCFARGYFTATYAPVRDTSVAGGPPVFVN
jgi:hypothetical protein